MLSSYCANIILTIIFHYQLGYLTSLDKKENKKVAMNTDFKRFEL